MLQPFFDADGVTIYHGDCRLVLASLPEGCVHTCVTSPPYWGLRDYGVDGQLGVAVHSVRMHERAENGPGGSPWV